MKDKDKDGMACGGKVKGYASGGAIKTKKAAANPIAAGKTLGGHSKGGGAETSGSAAPKMAKYKIKGPTSYEHFSKGGKVKCATGGLTVRGMGCAVRGGSYKGMK